MPAEIIVVDDGSTDGTGDLARSFGATVVSLAGGPHGPAAARNRGALEATGDILVFLDADVAVHTTTLERIADHFAVAPDVAALFGSYDDRPAEPGIVSRYKNLLHHFTHQHSRADAKTFWAGCGAIRREVFVECGGFDERFRRPSIEDIDLGLRLWQAGHRIRSCPEIQATHLKRWTLAGLIHTDVFLRDPLEPTDPPQRFLGRRPEHKPVEPLQRSRRGSWQLLSWPVPGCPGHFSVCCRRW